MKELGFVDGSFAPMANKGLISSFDGLILENVLHVPKIFYNLLSISKLTRNLLSSYLLTCTVSFQDLSSEKMIVTTDIVGDSISLMTMLCLGVIVGLVYCHLIFSTFEKDCILWHFHLGPQTFNI